MRILLIIAHYLFAVAICTVLMISAQGCTYQRGWDVHFGVHPISNTDKNEGFQAPDTIPVRGLKRGAVSPSNVNY